MLKESSEMVNKLQANVSLFRNSMTAAGFNCSGAMECPIVPVMLGDARLASEMSDELLKRGVYVIGFSYPVVPKDKARIRVQLSASHSTSEVNQVVNAFVEVGKMKGVIA
jgi:glycine C-acetyltransferase